MDSKEHPMQIDAVLVMSNGDVAISGGPRTCEIMIYRSEHLFIKGQKGKE